MKASGTPVAVKDVFTETECKLMLLIDEFYGNAF